jgi:hypothetical protein
MVTIEDDMHDLKEMIQKQTEEIERMNKERGAWQKQQLEFQAILVNLGLGQQPQRHENCQKGQNPQVEKQVSMMGPQILLSQLVNIPPRFPDIDQVERVAGNNIQI